MSRAPHMAAVAGRRLGALGVALAAAAFWAGCESPAGVSGAPGTSATVGSGACACGSATVVDPALIAFLSKARAAHHRADLAEQTGDTDGAVAVLLRLAQGPVPGALAAAPEVREVLADTRARLAELRSAGGEFELAERDIEAGLVLAVEATHFRGRLLEVRGLVEERRAAALARAGNDEGARRARGRAVDAYEAAMDVQEQVIAAQLGAGAASERPGSPPTPSSSPAPSLTGAAEASGGAPSPRSTAPAAGSKR